MKQKISRKSIWKASAKHTVSLCIPVFELELYNRDMDTR